MVAWHNGIAGCWAVVRAHGLDLATLYAADESWSVEARDGRLDGPARARVIARRAALQALEIILVTALDDVRAALQMLG